MEHDRRELLRFLTAGSVDDGKSTLIGRLLHDSDQVYDDHLATLRRDSQRLGAAGGATDFALLTDGLRAEREQGITIDVAYRYFATERRKFIIADCPGHAQYTRNMVTGASTCDLALVLVDARHGVVEQTRHHAVIAALLGISHVVVCVNKMDLVDYDEAVFTRIRADYASFAARLETRDVHFLPVSALAGDNVVARSERMPWFCGEPLLSYLEGVHIAADRNLIDLRFPVQLALRPDAGFRGLAGSVASGILRRGQPVVAVPSGQRAVVERIVTFDGERELAFPPQAVIVCLDREVDVGRGEMLVQPRNLPRVVRELEATVVWMHDEPLSIGRRLRIKQTTRWSGAEVSAIRHRIELATLSRRPAVELGLNDIGRVSLELAQPLAVDAYERNRGTGALILVDPESNETLGAAMVLDRGAAGVGLDAAQPPEPGREALRRRTSAIDPAEREARYGQRPQTLWLTGLPRSGKTTLAYGLERRLFDAGHAVWVLDGENLRLGLSADLGFSTAERAEQLRRAAELARSLNEAGLLVIVALLSPRAVDRAQAREIIGADRFMEVFVDAPVETCAARDTEGLYERAERGEIARFTGVSADYEAPETPALRLATAERDLEECLAELVALALESAKVSR
ncbi:MAG: bifunctional sulfate adenylyltransferase subunit 1/adenylylsulfate kinase [Proteobacteria bacterium]|nr:MAG: bifunctional sulfate adenylyltransferase subunit 1/adenylylsulfate kinase [Pseudomonadota bacterium]